MCQPDDYLSHAMWRSTRAKLAARRGEVDDALRLSAGAVEWVRRSDGVVFLANTLIARGEVLQLIGSDQQAREVLEEALALYQRKGVVPAVERTHARLEAIPPETADAASREDDPLGRVQNTCKKALLLPANTPEPP